MASALTNNIMKMQVDCENVTKLTSAILNHKPYIATPYYKELSYIETTGTQYLNLGVPLWSNNNWAVETKIRMSKLYDYQHLLSVNDDDTYHETWVNASGYYCVRLKKDAKKEVVKLAANTTYILKNEFNNGSCKVYVGSELKNTYSFGTFSCADNLRFGKRDSGWFIGRIYSIKLWQDGVLIRNFVPAKNLETGAAGMWDKVNNIFITNAGSGTFGEGSVIL